MKTRTLKADGVGVVSVPDEHAAADAVIEAHKVRAILARHDADGGIPKFEVATFNDARVASEG